MAPRHPVGNEVSPLWEWLPATIIAALMPLPQKKSQRHWKTIKEMSHGCRLVAIESDDL
jgi:hypothetical protein